MGIKPLIFRNNKNTKTTKKKQIRYGNYRVGVERKNKEMA